MLEKSEKHKRIQDRLEHLDSLYAERDLLHGKLQRSLAIQEMFPGCFQLGKVRSFFKGNVHSPWQLKFMIVVNKDSVDIEKREFDLTQVPEFLLDGFLEKQPRFIQKKIEKFLSGKFSNY